MNQTQKKQSKPNCYKCKYRGTVAGSAHSCCNHPSFKEAMGSSMGQLMSIFGSVGRTAPIQSSGGGDIIVKGNSHGIRNGWFQHPFNFDPVWLENCNGFEAKKRKGVNNEVSF